MLNNTPEAREIIALRFLNAKQPFFPLPSRIPENKLPLEFEDVLKEVKDLERSLSKEMTVMEKRVS